MKKITILLILMLVISLLSILINRAIAQDQKEVISLFEKRVKIFTEFFLNQPKLLDKTSYKDTPTGYVFYYRRFDECKISYDVRKTDSLISPYMGYITLTWSPSDSRNCGDFKSRYSDPLFTNIELARKNKDNESCYKPSPNKITATVIFAFQENKWIYKGVQGQAKNVLYTAFGTPLLSGQYIVDDNTFWKVLIE